MDQSQQDVQTDAEGGAKQARRIGGTIRLAPKQDERPVEEPVSVIICPVCRLKNPKSETYCAECGFLLGSSLEGIIPLPSAEEIARFPHLEDAVGRVLALKPGVNTVGREGTDIILADLSVSRYHAIIVYDEERELYSVEDSGSTNSTRVNGEILPARKPVAINPGDELRFGNINVRFVVQGKVQIGQEGAFEPYSKAEPTLPTAAYSSDLVGEAAGVLVLVRGSAEREFILEQGANTIGRNDDNRITLTGDRYVSGHHARIDVEGDAFLLLDMGSTNGTFLNGLRLTTNTAIAISDGDAIMFGGLLFNFHKINSHPTTTIDRTLLGAPTLEHLSAGVIDVGSDG
jgi:pSer/pThr/pTyr-binding forkhead associated (FHA) protein